jgi:hypothetical protein
MSIQKSEGKPGVPRGGSPAGVEAHFPDRELISVLSAIQSGKAFKVRAIEQVQESRG